MRKFREVPVGRQTVRVIDGQRYESAIFELGCTYSMFPRLFKSKKEYSQMTSFLRKFIVGQAKRERGGEEERRERKGEIHYF